MLLQAAVCPHHLACQGDGRPWPEVVHGLLWHLMNRARKLLRPSSNLHVQAETLIVG